MDFPRHFPEYPAGNLPYLHSFCIEIFLLHSTSNKKTRVLNSHLQEIGFSSVIMLFNSCDRFYFKKGSFGECRHFHTGTGRFIVSEPLLINCIDCLKIIDIV